MKKLQSLVLVLAMLMFALVLFPSKPTLMEETGTGASDNGLQMNKSAALNEDGSYTITLEAFATGKSIVTEVVESAPTDIILVIDQSGSMKFLLDGGDFSAYSSKSNSTFYSYRHNGGYYVGLYAKLSDGVSYAPVEVNIIDGYTASSSTTNSSVYSTYNNGTKLYIKVNGAYKHILLSRSGSGNSYQYTYTFYNGATTTVSGNTLPTFTQFGADDNKLYSLPSSGSNYVYEYSWNDGGQRKTYQSKGSSTKPGMTFYERESDSGSHTRLQTTQEILTSFVAQVSENSKANGIQHRIAIVGFASGSLYGTYSGSNYGNTELFIGSTSYTYNSSNIKNQYSKAFQDMSTDTGASNVSKSVNALTASGGTCVDLGLEIAKNIFDNNTIKEGETRNRVVIVLTDGSPGVGQNDDDYYDNNKYIQSNVTTALNAVELSSELKTTYGATVYTVGIQDGANPADAGDGSLGDNTVSAAFSNWFLHNISSNNGVPQNPGYYLAAANGEDLNNIFTQISDYISSGGSHITLGADAVLRDYMTEQFENIQDVQIQTYHCVGISGNNYQWQLNDDLMGAEFTVDEAGNFVSVTGFDYAEHYVGTVTQNGVVSYRGDKIVVTFTVTPKEGFLGGNQVITNEIESGIYEDEDNFGDDGYPKPEEPPVGEFPVPDVDVTIPDVDVTEIPDIQAAAEDIDVYLMENVTLADIKNHTKITVGGAELDLNQDDYGLEPWQTEYVNISIAYQDADGKTFTSYKSLTADTTYTVVATVTPKNEGTASAKNGSDTGRIWVYKPVLTYQDGISYYGDSTISTDWENDYLVSIVWKHGDKTAPAIMGTAPTLATSYTWDSYGKITDGIITTKQDIPVDVSVKIGNTDVSQYVTFDHQDCEYGEKISNANFVVHVETCKLTISKIGSKDGEPCVFTVLKDGEYYTQVTLNGRTGTTVSKTLYELPVGTYSIAEDEAWSWRYDASYSAESVTLSASKPSAAIRCTNTATHEPWLNYFSVIVENIFGVSKSAD